MDTFALRPATPLDVPFLIAAVKAAESVPTGDGLCTYEKIFGLSADELPAILEGVLSADGAGHQLTYSTFFILTNSGHPAACCSAWIEGEGGSASGFKSAMVLMPKIGLKRWNQSKAAIKAFAESAPHRTARTLQMETFYVEAALRGQGMTGRLIDSVIASFRDRGAQSPSAEISLLESNTQALRAYQRAGFAECWRTATEHPLFRELTASRGFIQVRREL